MERRGFLKSILAAGVAPAAVASGVLMPVRNVWTPNLVGNLEDSICYFPNDVELGDIVVFDEFGKIRKAQAGDEREKPYVWNGENFQSNGIVSVRSAWKFSAVAS